MNGLVPAGCFQPREVFRSINAQEGATNLSLEEWRWLDYKRGRTVAPDRPRGSPQTPFRPNTVAEPDGALSTYHCLPSQIFESCEEVRWRDYTLGKKPTKELVEIVSVVDWATARWKAHNDESSFCPPRKNDHKEVINRVDKWFTASLKQAKTTRSEQLESAEQDRPFRPPAAAAAAAAAASAGDLSDDSPTSRFIKRLNELLAMLSLMESIAQTHINQGGLSPASHVKASLLVKALRERSKILVAELSDAGKEQKIQETAGGGAGREKPRECPDRSERSTVLTPCSTNVIEKEPARHRLMFAPMICEACLFMYPVFGYTEEAVCICPRCSFNRSLPRET
ncbi:unnamed protein product [Vitrella brassicaformis CCMP3155]|uniref:Uncharacterized protein n=2 Tax=Vitrella brassicaformis TaxID=1169539 RepID=A0A0G4F2V6_VITBC|nr:unnamed protein product [Vitrella brassicaformis CCMP3155]|mmetsp:Transcript_1515/g.3287  ORF Transcript_1515/g.3287 Transcript_1515/m.3287 type:complete len:340 (+) Transcript_1515:3-1022(+)|eukprot:CEM06371.1 unnamed protein product [Vitrella brassicaformis CCMP3155]